MRKFLSICVTVLLALQSEAASPAIVGISFEADAPADHARVLFPGGRPKAVTLSFDDATIHDRRLVRILNAYGIRGTFHVPFYLLPGEGFVTTQEVRSLYAGHEVTVHLGGTQMESNSYRVMVEEARRGMEGLVGYAGRGMAYEGGECTDMAIQMLPQAGIAYSRCVGSDGSFSLKTNFYTWNTTCHEGGTADFLDRFLESAGAPAWFSIWGHSWEYEQSGTWGHWEGLCRKLGGRSNVWYATCVEMADYLRAGMALELTKQGRGVRNPGDIPVWLTVAGKTLCVPAGEERGWEQAGRPSKDPLWPPGAAPTIPAKAPAHWVAFNDLAWSSMQPSQNITLYGFHELHGGPLIDFATGIRLPVSVTLAGVKAAIYGEAPAKLEQGAAALEVFDPDAISMTGYARMEEGEATLTVEGLNPKRRYDLVVYGSRGSLDAGYETRLTRVELRQGKVAGKRPTGTTLRASDVGRVWRMDGVVPTAAGTIQIGIQAVDGGGYLNAFMIRSSRSEPGK